jgi:trimeric autotransporter adhesin
MIGLRHTFTGSSVQITYSSISSSSSIPSSSSSSESLAGILPMALADLTIPFTPLICSSSSSSSASSMSMPSSARSSLIFFLAAARLAFLLLAGSLGPPLTSSSSESSSESSSASLSSLASPARMRSISSLSKPSSEESSSDMSSSASRAWRMTLSVARGTAPSSPSGSTLGSMAAMVMRKAEGISELAGIMTSPQGTSRPNMAIGCIDILDSEVNEVAMRKSSSTFVGLLLRCVCDKLQAGEDATGWQSSPCK